MAGKLLNEIEGEVAGLLSDLIRINTSNPPGNEMESAKYLAETLGEEGIDCELFESAPGRGNLVTRMKGTGKRPSLLLLSHLDVVPANREEWTVDPFGGVMKDGFVWGRGALDMKGMTAIEVMTMKLLKRNRLKLKGDVILAATADEEKGGNFGIDYLLRKHLEKIQAPYVLNEGGGGGVAIATPTGNIFVVQTSEKGLLWIKIKAKGTPGHGSVPDSADNAILRMNKVIEKLCDHCFQPIITQTVARFIQELAEGDVSLEKPLNQLLADPESSDQMLEEVDKIAPNMAIELRSRIKNTISPTMIRGGAKENIIPSECQAVFDCRILPGQTTTQMLDLIKKLLRDIDPKRLTFEVVQAQEPSESPVETPLFKTMVKVLRDFDPNCKVTPILMTGGTDSRYFRERGSTCYGFQPRLAEMQYNKIFTREHGIDERISIRDLVFGTSVLYETIKKFLC
jgi:acetylornithine deacetylase/succinyl-diaminopimelate desuccinylase-like protein